MFALRRWHLPAVRTWTSDLFPCSSKIEGIIETWFLWELNTWEYLVNCRVLYKSELLFSLFIEMYVIAGKVFRDHLICGSYTGGNGAQGASYLWESGQIKRLTLILEISIKLTYQKPNIHTLLIFLIQEHCFGLHCVPKYTLDKYIS